MEKRAKPRGDRSACREEGELRWRKERKEMSASRTQKRGKSKEVMEWL